MRKRKTVEKENEEEGEGGQLSRDDDALYRMGVAIKTMKKARKTKTWEEIKWVNFENWRKFSVKRKENIILKRKQKIQKRRREQCH